MKPITGYRAGDMARRAREARLERGWEDAEEEQAEQELQADMSRILWRKMLEARSHAAH